MYKGSQQINAPWRRAASDGDLDGLALFRIAGPFEMPVVSSKDTTGHGQSCGEGAETQHGARW